MRRVYISYCESDSEAALYVATQLRGRGIDLFIDYERMMNNEGFTQRLANEIRSRDCVVLLQTYESLSSGLVQAELGHALEHNVAVITLVMENIDIRASGEFAFLLHNNPIDFTSWAKQKQARPAINELEARLRSQEDTANLISAASAESIQELATLEGHESWVRSAKFSSDGSLLGSVSNDKTLRVWDLRPDMPETICTLTAHNASVWDIAFHPNDSLMASCANDNTVRLWELEELPDLYELTRFVDHHDPVYSLAFSPDGGLLASASHDNSVHVRDIERIKHNGIAEAIVPLMHSSHVYSVAFSPDGELIASASRDSTVRIWEVDRTNLRSLARARPQFLIGHMSWVNTVEFSPYGNLLASTSHDRTIRLWDTTTLEEVGMLSGHTDSINSAVFSPDGRLLASTSKDNTIRIWDVRNQREITSIVGHDRWVNNAVFSPDGRFLATASGDNTIKIWGVGKPARNGR